MGIGAWCLVLGAGMFLEACGVLFSPNILFNKNKTKTKIKQTKENPNQPNKQREAKGN